MRTYTCRGCELTFSHDKKLGQLPCWCPGCKGSSDAWKGARRTRHLRVYGLTPETYAEKLADQRGLCAICEEPTENFVVDHDHECCPGTRSCGDCVRGLLCTECNRGLGQFRDSVQNLEAAIGYLQNNRRIARHSA